MLRSRHHGQLRPVDPACRHRSGMDHPRTGPTRPDDGGRHRFTDDDFVVRPPLELHTDGGGSFDADVADAVHEIVAHPDATPNPNLARRLMQAIRWWVKAWRNSASLTSEDRIVLWGSWMSTS